MHVISLKKLRGFWIIHADAEGPLRAWHSIAEREYWESLNDIRATIRSADQVGKCFVFNIAGNKYRLIVRFKRGRLYVRHVLTQAEYDRDVWKKDCY
jgi:mRNA interferase HigB